jgi:dipeptidyl aminopeptidase/acylaminoacyl peptidase
MIRLTLIVAAMFAAALGKSETQHSATNANDGTLLEAQSYSFPAYDKTEEIEFYSSRPEYEGAVADKQFEFKKLRYSSDGLSVTAYLYKPTQTEGKVYPAIIFNRGSGPAGDSAPLLISMFHRLASSGFVILAPQYRGSDGGEGRDEIGGSDLDDVKNILPLAKSLGFIDMKNLFMYGESRGGMMTYQAIRDGVPINAAAAFGAFTDLEIMNKSPYVQKVIPQIWPDYETHKEEIIRRRSAKYWADRLSIPLLIMNGGADQQVDPSQPLQLAEQLQSLSKTYELIIYANDDHFLEHNRNDRDLRAIAWFESYLVR